jgi:multiple sugar transport system substrate-binding protein
MHKLKFFSTALFVLLLVLSLGGSVLAQDDLDGVTLTVLIHPTLYGALGGDGGIIAEFEAATGATVEIVTAPIPEHTEKALVEFIAQRGTYDVIAMQNSDMTANFNPFFLPLDDYVARDAEEMQWEDFLPAMRDWGLVDGVQLGVPFRAGTQMLYYRTDLLEAAGVEVPTTLEELIAAAKALTQDTDGDGNTDIYGLVQRGKAPTELAHDWLTSFYAAGGDFLTEDGLCGFDSPAGVQATTEWTDLYQSGVYPPDIFAWGRDDYITAMQQGRAAMGVYLSSYWGRLTDPEDSLFADQIGWAVPPSNPDIPQGRGRGGGWVFVINRFSETPDAAWELLKYVTSPENHLRSAVEFGNGPVRASSFESEAYLELYPLALDWLTSTANSMIDPAIPEQPQILDIISVEVTAAMQGNQTAEETVARICSQANELLDR